MPRIVAVSQALPPHVVTQGEVRQRVLEIFPPQLAQREQVAALFDHARIATRQFMRPLEWYALPHSPGERNRIYHEEGLQLMEQAVRGCLDQAGCDPGQIDQILVVSSTGHATPTLDTYLINRLGLRPSVRRLPLWGLGCAGGAAGLARAADYCHAAPTHRVLLVAIECCSLTFCPGDVSKKNLVATALFADGAAAALVVGDSAPEPGVAIRASRSHLFPDTYHLMGWDFDGAEMTLVLSPRIPLLIRQELQPLVADFCAAQGEDPGQLSYFITHPGGAHILDAYVASLGLDEDALALSAAALRDHGNVSSVSVLLVLERWLAQAPPPGFGLLSAFGPGFSAELLLLQV